MTSPVPGYITDNRNLDGGKGTPNLSFGIKNSLLFERDHCSFSIE